VRFYGDRWCKADLVTVTENHGGPKRLTRLRLVYRATLFQRALLFGIGYLCLLAWAVQPHWALYVAPFAVATLLQVRAAQRQLRAAVMAAVLTTARQLGMTVVGMPDLFTRKPAVERDELAAESAPLAARLGAVFSWRRLLANARRVTLSLF
jgi:hypothetical protein